MQASVHLDHVAAGCNRNVGVLDWSEGGLIAYGAHRAVFIFDTLASRVVATMPGHTQPVTCLRWFTAADFGLTRSAMDPTWPLALASGGADGSLCIWLVPRSAPSAWTLAAQLPAHSAPVTSVALHRLGPNRVLAVTTGGDGDVAAWTAQTAVSAAPGGPAAGFAVNAAWQLAQRLSYGTKLQNCAALAPLPSQPASLLLALGGADAKVRLLLLEDVAVDTPAFVPACELLGHQNWVRGLAFTAVDGKKLLLASASQDRYIRLWAVAPEESPSGGASASAVLTRLAPRPRFLSSSSCVWHSATAEALLIGHEDWVHSVAWQPRPEGCVDAAPCLLSASMDRTMMMWVEDGGLWLSRESVGDAGVNHLGYFTGVWDPTDGRAVVSHGFTGALHLWRRNADDCLRPPPAVGGHYGGVVDAAWGVDGSCLLTVGTDQTTRITARLAAAERWCEIARPQVHGHDFSCVAAIPAAQGTHAGCLFVSGSEEKVLRVLEAPVAFMDTLAMAQGRQVERRAAAPSTPAYGASLPALGLSNKAVYAPEAAAAAHGGGEGGTAPGGSGAETFDLGPDFAPSSEPSAVEGAPLEEHLAQNTLWPEIHKLYGHGNELFCVAAHPEGGLLASASRAQSAATAGVIVWDTATWTPRGLPLEAHSLTVTQLSFSPNGAFLASASRDRTVCVFAKTTVEGGAALSGAQQNGNGNAAELPSCAFKLAAQIKAHSRIVWGLAWTPDSSVLLSASRDCSVKAWRVGGGGAVAAAAAAAFPFSDSVRAVALAPEELPGSANDGEGRGRRCLGAVGLENGEIEVGVVSWRENRGSGSGSSGEGNKEKEAVAVGWETVWRSTQREKHAAAVRRLCWRVAGMPAGSIGQRQRQQQRYDLASCGDDHSVRIFGVAWPL